MSQNKRLSTIYTFDIKKKQVSFLHILITRGFILRREIIHLILSGDYGNVDTFFQQNWTTYVNGFGGTTKVMIPFVF